MINELFGELSIISRWLYTVSTWKSKLKSATPRNTCRNMSFWILLCILKRHHVVVCAYLFLSSIWSWSTLVVWLTWTHPIRINMGFQMDIFSHTSLWSVALQYEIVSFSSFSTPVTFQTQVWLWAVKAQHGSIPLHVATHIVWLHGNEADDFFINKNHFKKQKRDIKNLTGGARRNRVIGPQTF